MTSKRMCPDSNPPHEMSQDGEGRWYCPIKSDAEKEARARREDAINAIAAAFGTFGIGDTLRRQSTDPRLANATVPLAAPPLLEFTASLVSRLAGLAAEGQAEEWPEAFAFLDAISSALGSPAAETGPLEGVTEIRVEVTRKGRVYGNRQRLLDASLDVAYAPGHMFRSTLYSTAEDVAKAAGFGHEVS